MGTSQIISLRRRLPSRFNADHGCGLKQTAGSPFDHPKTEVREGGGSETTAEKKEALGPGAFIFLGKKGTSRARERNISRVIPMSYFLGLHHQVTCYNAN